MNMVNQRSGLKSLSTFVFLLVGLQSLLLIGIPLLNSSTNNISSTNLPKESITSAANTQATAKTDLQIADLTTTTAIKTVTPVAQHTEETIKSAEPTIKSAMNRAETIIRSAVNKVALGNTASTEAPLQYDEESLENHNTYSEETFYNQQTNNPTNNGHVINIAYEVKRGDTLSTIWQQIGGVFEQASGAAQAFKLANVSLSSLRAGETLEIQMNRQGEVQELKKQLNDAKRLVLTSLGDHSFDAEIIEPQIIHTERTVSGTITHTLAQSAIDHQLPYEVVDEFIDLFSGRVEFSKEVQPGDTFSVIYEDRSADDGTLLAPGPIKAASYMSKGDIMVAIRYENDDKKVTYYDQKGNPLGDHFLRYPVQFSRISSMFSKARFHPVLKRWRPHNGVDFAAPTGTPVRTVAEGRVVEAGYTRGNGNWVKIQHDEKYASAYLHLSKIAKGIQKGARVSRGQHIGNVGSTGFATGPHLHYSFYVHGKYVDPLQVKLPAMSQHADPLPPQYLKKFLRKLRRHHAHLQMADAGETGSSAVNNLA